MDCNVSSNIKLIQLFFITFIFVCNIHSSEVPRPRGVSLSRASLYHPGKDFTCFDGSKTIPFTQVNDDYCDCEDASDEPGTSACLNGIFHCTNSGHKSSNIPSNRVNDGICDCCDGSDEYDSQTKCVNNCLELGKHAREAAQRRAELVKAGKELRLDMSQKGIQQRQEKEAKLVELQKNKKEAEEIKKEKEELKKKAEEQEGAALEYYRKLEEEAKKKKVEEEAAKNRAEAIDTFNKLDSNQDGSVDIQEIKNQLKFDKDRDGEVSDEEAKSFLNNQETIDIDAFIDLCWSNIKPYFLLHDSLYKPPEEETTAKPGEQDLEEPDEEGTEDDDEEEAEEEHEETDDQPKETTVEESLVKYDDETQRLVQLADTARSQYQEADMHVRDIETEMNDINEYLGKDFGPDQEFATLQAQCFPFEDHEYVYKLCPFEKTSQQPLSGSSETRLGSWGSWSGPSSDKYQQMIYDRGQSCWNGPQRSTRVNIVCGGENKLTRVTEPNRCEYVFDFSTPAACKDTASDGDVRDEVHDEL